LNWQSGMFFNSREASWSVNDENLCWLLLQIIWPNTDSPKIQGPDLSEISGPVSETSELQLHLLPRENFAHLLRRNLKAMLHQHFSANVEVHILMEAVVHRDHLGLEWAGWGYIYICIYQLHVSFFVTVFERNWLGVPCWIWKLKLLGRKNRWRMALKKKNKNPKALSFQSAPARCVQSCSSSMLLWLGAIPA